MDTLPFYIALFVHLISLAVGFGSVMVIDFFGLQWMRKKVSIDDVNRVAGQAQKLVWLGWGGLVASGLVLIYFKGFVDNLTVIKLFFVAMLGANGLFLHAIKNTSERIGKGSIPDFLKFRIGLATIISQVGWWGAIAIGFVHRQWDHDISWPDNPGMYISLMVLAIALAALAGELLIKKERNV